MEEGKYYLWVTIVSRIAEGAELAIFTVKSGVFEIVRGEFGQDQGTRSWVMGVEKGGVTAWDWAAAMNSHDMNG